MEEINLESKNQYSQTLRALGGDTNISYIGHALFLLIGYVLPVILVTFALAPFSGSFAFLLPVMIFMRSWKIIPFLLVLLFFFKEIFEKYIFKSYLVSVFTVWAIFLGTNISLVSSFFNKPQSVILIFVLPLVCSSICLFTYFMLVKWCLSRKRKRKELLVRLNSESEVGNDGLRP